MTDRQSDVQRASAVIGRNIRVTALMMGAILLPAYLLVSGDAPSAGESTQWTQIGTRPIVYDRSRADRLLYTGNGEAGSPGDARVLRIEVLDSGLIAGRGIVAVEFDADTPRPECRDAVVRLIVADAWERLYEYFVPRHLGPDVGTPRRAPSGQSPDCRGIRPGRLPDLEVCPHGVCDDVDHRGIAVVPSAQEPRLVVADAHQRRLSLRDMKGNIVGTLGGAHSFTGITAVTRSPDGSIFATTVPSPAERELARREGRTAGKLFVLDASGAAADVAPVEVPGELERPVGVAYSSCPARVYVADATEEQTLWHYYEPIADAGAPADTRRRWQRAGVLATEAADRGATPVALQGMAIAQCRTEADGSMSGGEVFAAGPGGLFVYRSDGTLIARYVLSERISGLAWGGDRALYMTIGHRIARLVTRVGGAESTVPVSPPSILPANVRP